MRREQKSRTGSDIAADRMERTAAPARDYGIRVGTEGVGAKNFSPHGIPDKA